MGFSKRSFAEWGSQIKSAFNEGTTTAEKFKNVLSAAFKDKNSPSLITNSFGEVVSQDNIDTYIPKLDKDQASTTLQNLQAIQSQVDAGTRSWNDYFSRLNTDEQWQIDFVQNTDLQKASTNDLIKANDAARKSILAQNNAIKSQTLSAKAGSVALKALSMAGNMLVMAFISKGVQLAATAIDNYVHSAEKCKERVNDMMSAYESAISTAETHKETINEIGGRYEELSKGVNNLGENVSLTADEYEEYNGIVNKIAEMFPTMTQGYTSEGNAILKLKGNVDALTEAYDAEAQAAYQALIASGEDSDGNDIIADWRNSLGEDKGKATNITQAVKELQAFVTSNMDAQTYTELHAKAGVGNYDGMTDDEAMIASSQFLRYKIKFDIDEDGIITDEELAKAKESAKVLLQTYEAEIESDFSNVKTLANAYLMTNEDYKKLDAQSQTAASLLINSLSATSDIAQTLMTDSKESIGNYVNFLVQTLSSDNSEANTALIDLFTTDFSSLSYDDAKAMIDQNIDIISEALQQDPVELKAMLGFSAYDDNQNLLNNVQEKLQDEFDDKVGELSMDELKIAAEEIEVDDGTLLSWDQLLAKIKEVQDSRFDYKDFNVEDFSNTISEITSAYSTLTSAIEEYNANGAYSLNTVTSLLSLKPEYLALLAEENGQLALNEQGLRSIIEAQLQEAQSEIYGAGIAKLKALADESAGTASENAASQMADSASDIAAQTQAYEENTAAALTNAAVKAVEEGADQKDVDAIIKETEDQVNALQAAVNGLTFDVGGVTGGFSKAGSSASSAAKSSMEATQKDWKEHLDQCLELYQAELDAGLIDFETFLSKSNSMIEEFYRDGKISAKEYYDYVEKMLETQKGIYDKVLSAVTKRFDREIDLIQDSTDAIEKQNEALEKQKDEYDTILSVVDSVYEKEIENIRSQQDAIQDTIDALQEENDERKFALQLEQAKWELYRAQTQRTKKVFNGTEFIYDTDKDAIRDAQENLADLTLEQTVDGLEKEKDALDAVIEELEYYRDIWSEISGAKEKSENEQLAIALWGEDYEKLILSNRLSDIENFKDNYLSTQQQINDNQTLIDSYNEKIEYYEALKESWNSITDAYETAMNEQLAAQVLGADWESQILSGRLETLQHFRDEYIAIQQAITDATLNAANASVENTNNTGNTGNAGGNNFNVPVPESDSTSKYATYKIVGNPNGYSSSGLATSQIVPSRGDGIVKRGNKWYVYKKINTYSNAGKAQSQIVPDGGDGFIEAYASGTGNAKKGVSLVGEKGAETIIDNKGNVSLVTQPTLVKMQGSEIVKNAAATKSLLENYSVVSLEKNSPTLKRPSDVMLEQWQKIVPDLSDRLLPATAALLTAHQFTETHSQSTPVVQNITLTLPNVTNNSGYERIKKELRQMQIDAYQNAHRRNP